MIHFFVSIILIINTFVNTNAKYHDVSYYEYPCQYDYCYEYLVHSSSSMVVKRVGSRVNSGDPVLFKSVLYEYNNNRDLILTDDDYDFYGVFFPENSVANGIIYDDENNTIITRYKIDNLYYCSRVVFDTTTKTVTTIDTITIGENINTNYLVKIFDGANKIYSCRNNKLYIFDNGQYIESGTYGGNLVHMCASSVIISSGIWIGDYLREKTQYGSTGYMYFHPNDGNGFFSPTPAYTIDPEGSSSYTYYNCGFSMGYHDGKIIYSCGQSYYRNAEISYLFPEDGSRAPYSKSIIYGRNEGFELPLIYKHYDDNFMKDHAQVFRNKGSDFFPIEPPFYDDDDTTWGYSIRFDSLFVTRSGTNMKYYVYDMKTN